MKWLVEFDMVADEILTLRDGAGQPVDLVLSQGKIKTVMVEAEEQNEAVEKGVGLITENIVAQKQSLNRAVRKYREAVDKNAEKIYVVGYDGEEGNLIVELREKASEQPCNRAYQTGDSEYVSYVEAASKKEALKRGVREIEKLLKKQKKNVERQVEELDDSWGKLDDLETELEKLVVKAEMEEEGK